MTPYQRQLQLQNHWRAETSLSLAIAMAPELGASLAGAPEIALLVFEALLAREKILHGDPSAPCPLGILRMNMERDRFRYGGQPPWRPPTQRRSGRW